MAATLAILLAVAAGVLSGFSDESPRCGKTVEYCFAVDVFIVVRDGAPVQSPDWLAAEIRRANALFAAIHVGFEVDDVRPLAAEWAHVSSPLDRDRLGRRPRDRGDVHVFVVEQLDDIDVAGNLLYGVHWRDRAETSRRWIILSARDSSGTTLAHEMGHYFGLPHSRHRISIMNKTPRDDPPWTERVFAAPELERMRARRDQMVEEGFLARRGARP